MYLCNIDTIKTYLHLYLIPEARTAALQIFLSLVDTCCDFGLFMVHRAYIKGCKFIFIFF